jgi:hypothetical protein
MKVTLTCTACDKDFCVPPSRKSALFCSSACYLSNQHKRRGSVGLVEAGRDLVGRQFGRLNVNAYEGGRLVCLCSCGTICRFYKKAVVDGRVVSCGCFNREKKRLPGEATSRRRWFNYLTNAAAQRSLPFHLTFEEADTLCRQPCHYCGAGPSPWLGAKRAYLASAAAKHTKNPDASFADTKVIHVNGLDRVDSSRGYEITNVVPCCRTCNTAKLDMTTESFTAWVRRAYTHMEKKAL